MNIELSAAPVITGGPCLQEWPTITADRAIRTLTPDIGIDPDAIGAFYDSVPKIEDKPPLSDLHVHASAAIVIDKGATPDMDRSQSGVFIWPGQRIPHYVPELKGNNGRATNPTVVVFIGSALLGSEGVRTPEMITAIANRAITHELVHYAQSGTDPQLPSSRRPVTQRVRDETLLVYLKAQRSMYDVLFDRTSATAALAACITSLALRDIESTVLMTVGTGAIVHGFGYGARKRARHDHRFENVYQNDPDEIEAFALQDEGVDIITLGGVNPDINKDELWVIRHRIHSSLPRKYVKRFMHRQTSVKPLS